MTTLYIMSFKEIIDWILDKIIKPVLKFLSDILGKILGFIFQEILAPILVEVLWPLAEFFIEAIMQSLAGAFYEILVRILKIIDVIEVLFDTLMGANPVRLGDKSGSIVTLLLTSPDIKKVYLMIVVFSLALLMLFSIYAVARSAADFDFKGKKPVSRVLKLTFSAFLQMLFLHAMIVVFLYMGDAFLTGIKIAFSNGSTNASLGTQIYLIATLKAANENANVSNYTYQRIYRTKPQMDDGLRKLFLGDSPQVDYGNSDVCIGYGNIFDEEYSGLFIVTDVDYILGIIASGAVLVILAMCMVIAIGRIFEMMILMLVSPFFVATMPIDDGKFFKAWMQSFSGKLFGAYGGYLAMRVYLSIIPLINYNLVFIPGSEVLDSVAKLLLICGGAWGTYKCFTLLTYFVDIQTAEHDSMVAGEAGSFVHGKLNALGAAIGKGMWKKMIAEPIKNRKMLRENANAQHEDAERMFKGLPPRDGGGHGGIGAGGGGGAGPDRNVKGKSVFTGANRDANGDSKHGFLFFKWTRDKNGKMTSFSVPFLFRMQSKDEVDKFGNKTGNKVKSFGFFGRTGSKEDGGMLSFNVKKNSKGKLAGGGFAITGLVNFDKSDKKGSTVSFLGNVEKDRGALMFGSNEEGKFNKFRVAGFQRERQVDGKFKTTEAFGGLLKTGYTTDAEGNVKKAYQTSVGLFNGRTKYYENPPVNATLDASGGEPAQNDNVELPQDVPNEGNAQPNDPNAQPENQEQRNQPGVAGGGAERRMNRDNENEDDEEDQ